MSDEQPIQHPRKSSGILGVLYWVALVLVLYVLSIGPVARYYHKRNAPPAVETFYAPLAALSNNFPPAFIFFDWYFKLWRVGR